MCEQIFITSFDALSRFEFSLGVFSEDVKNKIQIVAQSMQSRLNEIENRCHSLESEVAYWESEYDSAGEDDDTDYLAYKRQEAEEKLYRIRNLQRQVEESAEHFSRCARRVGLFTEQRSVEARHFLKRKLIELEEYAAINIENISLQHNNEVTMTGVSTGIEQSHAPLSLSQNSVQDFEKIALPKGFEWIRLDEVSDEELSGVVDESDFRKVSYSEMKDGLKRFEKDILPVLSATPQNSNADYFRQIDSKNGDDYVRGRLKIFEVFFGNDFIKLERFTGNSKYGTVESGRHRLKVAKDLGWKVIPAKVSEVKWSKNDSDR